MAKPVKIIVTGTNNRGDDAPTVEDLLTQIQDQVKIFKEVEEAISGEGSEQLIWRVTNVTKNSPITFEITPYPKVHGTDIENLTEKVVGATARGLKALGENEERPLHFTDKILKKLTVINKRVTNGLALTEVDFSEYEDAPNFTLNTVTAQRAIKRIERLKSPNVLPHRELGSVEGFVKTIGRDGYGRPVVTLTTRLDGKDVKCSSSDDGLDKIGHLEVEKVIKGLRIRAHGILHYKTPESLDRVDVERVEVFADTKELPKITDLIDPDFTNGLDSVEFIRKGRDDGYSH